MTRTLTGQKPKPAPDETERPAFYALATGGWRDYVTLLHPPYTVWHLSYVAIGAGLATTIDFGRLGATLAAFLLAMGVGAHALDELHGRPLGTRIGTGVLAALAAVSLVGAVTIGIVSCFWISGWLAVFIAFGAFVVIAYNLELFGGRIHDAFWFSLAWGAFPVLTGYFAQTERIRGAAVVAAGFAMLLSLAQRRLSTPVRLMRRRVRSVSGSLELTDGSHEPLTRESLLDAPETALRILSVATPLLATALVLSRL
jgi:hypothetical protein